MKATILSRAELTWLPDIPLASPLVLDLGSEEYDPRLVPDAEQRGHRVDRLLASVPSLEHATLDALAGQQLPCTARVTTMPTVRTALARARDIGRAHLAIELPVDSEADLATLKVLSSLGVLTAIEPRRLFAGGEVMLELLTDAILRPGRRSPVVPVDDLLVHFDDDEFDLARIDPRANDQHVDLRGGARPGPEAWSPVDAWRKRERFLAEGHPCAFCEGLPFCHGMLQPECGDACRAVFSELFELQSLRKRKDALAASRTAGGNRKEACGC